MSDSDWVKELAGVIDPDVWAASEDAQRTIGARWDFTIRRINSLHAARRVAAHLAPSRSPG